MAVLRRVAALSRFCSCWGGVQDGDGGVGGHDGVAGMTLSEVGDDGAAGVFAVGEGSATAAEEVGGEGVVGVGLQKVREDDDGEG